MIDRAFIFTGGLAPPRSRVSQLITDRDLIVAADSGLETAWRYGRQPDWVIGDFDSASPASLSKMNDSQIRRFPVDKDLTDTELALEALAADRPQSIILLGGGGGRLDHLLGIWALFGQGRGPNRWYTDNDEIIFIDRDQLLDMPAGTVLSFFGFGPKPRVSSRGLQWNLDAVDWLGGQLSLSNRSVGPIRLQIHSGWLVMVRSFVDEAEPVTQVLDLPSSEL